MLAYRSPCDDTDVPFRRPCAENAVGGRDGLLGASRGFSLIGVGSKSLRYPLPA